MKKIIKLLFALILTLTVSSIFCVTCFGDEPLSALITAQDQKLGDTFDIRISIGSNGGITNGSFNVIYDNKKVELISATSDTEMMSGVLYVINDKYADNALRISFASANVFGADGGDLMIVTFKATGTGQAAFSVEKLKLKFDNEKYDSVDSATVIAITGSEQTAHTVTAAPVLSTSLDTKTVSSTHEDTTAATSGTDVPDAQTSVEKSASDTQPSDKTTAQDTSSSVMSSAPQTTASTQNDTTGPAGVISSESESTTGSTVKPIPMKEKKSNSNIVIIIAVAAVILAAAGIITVVSKRKK